MVSSDKIMATKINNHADTRCFGKNFVPFSWTGTVCTVSPFLSTYEALADVKICSAATAVALDTGETVVLIFGQGLWFGEKMDKSLINPNQCRAYGVGVCDDPTDPHRHLGFYHEDQYLPLYMSGTTAGFESRCPTSQELDECKKFYMSDPDQWDPCNVKFFERHVSSVERGLPVLPPITNLIDESFSTFSNSVISAIKRGRDPHKKDPYKHLNHDEC